MKLNLRLRARLRLLSILQVNGLQSGFVKKKSKLTEECICKNCHTLFTGNFCPQCGQKSTTRRLTFVNIIEDCFELLTNFDSGILRSITELFWRPGYMIRDYIFGKRKGYMKPLSMLFFLGTVYYFFVWLVAKDAFLSFDMNDVEVNLSDEFQKYKPMAEVGLDYLSQLLNNPGALWLVLFLPSAPIAWLCFRRTPYGKVFNMMEFLHIQTFIACQMLVFTLGLGIIDWLMLGHLELYNVNFQICFLLIMWDYKQLFDIGWLRSFKLTAICSLLVFCTILLILVVSVISVAAYLEG